jgi:MFS family permease
VAGRISGWWAVALLLLVYALAYVDRQILSLLVGPIREDLAISDTQFSLLHGLSFALFYAVLGIPIGAQVDRGHRPRILAAGIALWSLFTCLCGLSGKYWQLFLCRTGVGVGEATVVPVTYSLLGDYFTPDRRGLAMGVFGSGVYIGMGIALLLGSALIGALEARGPTTLPYLGPIQPWQLALIYVGAPGLLLALGALALLEPRAAPGAAVHRSTPPPGAAPVRGLMSAHYRRFAAAIACHHLTVTFMVMALYAALAWAPEHFRRSYDVDASTSGLMIGLVTIGAGTAGVIGGGRLSDLLVGRHVRSARILLLPLAALLAIPAALLFALAPSEHGALAGYAGTILCLSSLSSIGPAALQDLFPPHLRGRGAAVYQLVANLVGLGLGPTLVALGTDYVFGDDLQLALSLATMLPVMLLAAALTGLAGLTPFQRATHLAAAEPDSSERDGR